MNFSTLAAACSLVALALSQAAFSQGYPLNANWLFFEDLEGEYIATVGLNERALDARSKSSAILAYVCTQDNELLLQVTPDNFTVPKPSLPVSYAFDGSRQEALLWASTGTTLAPYKADVSTLTTELLGAETFALSFIDASDRARQIDFDIGGLDEALNTLPCYEAGGTATP